MNDVYQIKTTNACFGIIVDHERVVDAAPIARWSKGKSWHQVATYFKQRGASVSKIYSTKQLNIF